MGNRSLIIHEAARQLSDPCLQACPEICDAPKNESHFVSVRAADETFALFYPQQFKVAHKAGRAACNSDLNSLP